MNPADLPIAGPILNVSKDYIVQNRHIASLAGMRVLCIGYSEPEIDEFIAPEHPSHIVALTLWEGHRDAMVSKYELVIGDITQKTSFPDGHFDAVVTLSVLEHLTPIAGACVEIHRILRPGGHLFAFFGPSWSSPVGHHLYHRPGDRLLDFLSGQMPAHMHLLCSPQEILRYYEAQGYRTEEGQAALHWIFEAGHINRLMYDDYADLLSQRFQFLLTESMYIPVPLSHLHMLRSRFPRYGDFSTYGARYILQALEA